MIYNFGIVGQPDRSPRPFRCNVCTHIIDEGTVHIYFSVRVNGVVTDRMRIHPECLQDCEFSLKDLKDEEES